MTISGPAFMTDLTMQDVDGTHTPISDPIRRAMYLKDLCDMLDV